MKHRVSFSAVVFAVVLLSWLAPSGLMAQDRQLTPLVVPDIPYGEYSEYKVTYADKEESSFALDGELATATGFHYTIFPYEKDGKKYYQTDEVELMEGGRYSKVKNHFELGANMRLLNYTESVFSTSGNMIRQSFANYDDPMFKVPGPTILTHCLTFWLRGIDFKVGTSVEFYLRLLGDSSPPWRMYANVESIETVTVPAGTFRCYKVVIDPDFKHFFGKWAWASIIIRPLVPDFFIWYEVDKPHKLIKFQGALGIKGITSEETHELTKYEIREDAKPEE